MVDVRRFDPSEPRDPDGKWGDGIPGGSAVKDALKIADRMDLDPDEKLISSSRLSDGAGDTDMNFAVVHNPEGNDVRIGIIPAEDSDKWRASNLGGTALLESAELRQFRQDLSGATTKAKDRARQAEKAWSTGKPPTDPVLLGTEPVDQGRVSTIFADLHWDVSLTDEEPTSWILSIGAAPDGTDSHTDPIRLDPARARALLKHLDGIQSQVDGPSAPARSHPEEVGRPMAPEGRYNDQHAPAGSADGGEFVAGGGGGSGKKSTPKGGKKAAPGHHRPMHHGSTGTLSYDPAANHGTGYESKNGDERVHALQQALNRLGVPDSSGKKLRDDGQLGPKTTSAVKALQKLLGLTPDGKVTPDLLKRITSMKALPAPKRSASVDVCVRSFGFTLEERARGGDGRTLEGYAAVFGSPTRIAALGGDFDEVIQRGAFARSLSARSPVLQWDHGKDPAVGTAPIGDIEDLREDDHGLYVRARLYDHPSVDRVRMAIQGRSVKGMSFRFQVPDGGDTWERRSGNVDLRTVADADVFELGPVAFPAYDSTTVSVRSLLAQLGPDEHRALLRELAHDLRSADPTVLTGQPAARSGGGGDTGAEPERNTRTAPHHLRQRLDDGALRARGILQ